MGSVNRQLNFPAHLTAIAESLLGLAYMLFDGLIVFHSGLPTFQSIDLGIRDTLGIITARLRDDSASSSHNLASLLQNIQETRKIWSTHPSNFSDRFLARLKLQLQRLRELASPRLNPEGH